MASESKALGRVQELCFRFLNCHETDHLAFALIDFSSEDFECFQLVKSGRHAQVSNKKVFYDLASLSKPMTNGLAYYARPELRTAELNLLLNHQAGLPAWGLLSHSGWKEQLSNYPVEKSAVLYSDFGAIRYMLEFDHMSDLSLEEVAKSYWDKDVLYWLDLNSDHYCPQYGYRSGRENRGEVHDPNAYNLRTFLPHAGCFATLEGLSRSLITMHKKFNFIEQVEQAFEQDVSRENSFIQGWDTSAQFPNVFGHLGFTGTAVWIDAKKRSGYVLLTNAVKDYWFHKKAFKQLRSDIGEVLWQSIT